MPIIVRHDDPSMLGRLAYQASYAQNLAQMDERRRQERQQERMLSQQRLMQQVQQQRAARQASRQQMQSFLGRYDDTVGRGAGMGVFQPRATAGEQAPVPPAYSPGGAVAFRKSDLLPTEETAKTTPGGRGYPIPAGRQTALDALQDMAAQRPGLENHPAYKIAVANVAAGGTISEELIDALNVLTPEQELESGQPISPDYMPGGLDVPEKREGQSQSERTTAETIQTGSWAEGARIFDERAGNQFEPNAPLTERALRYRNQLTRAIEATDSVPQLEQALQEMREAGAPPEMTAPVEAKLQEVESQQFEATATGILEAVQSNTQAVMSRAQRKLGRPLTFDEVKKIQADVMQRAFESAGLQTEDIPRFRQWFQEQREVVRQEEMRQAQEIRQSQQAARQQQMQQLMQAAQQAAQQGEKPRRGSSGRSRSRQGAPTTNRPQQ